MADYQITGTLSLEDQMSNVLKNAMNSVEQFSSKTQSAVQKASSSVESVSRSMQFGGAAVTAMGVKSMKSFGDFEASLNKAAVVAGGTSKNIGELADVANKMGADLPLSAQDAADAMVSMAQDGASIDTIKQEFPAIAKAATAAGSDLQTTASVVQQSMNIWGKSLGSPAQAAATLTATANMSNASVEDMQQVLADAGGTAKQMGLSMQDLSTAVGLTTNKGIPAAQAAQNLNFALTRMIKPSKQAQDVMSQLGLSYFDANGNMKPFAQILQELNQKTSGLTNEQKALNLTTLFGQAGYKVMSSLMDSVADTTGNATTSWSAYKSQLDKVTSSEEAAQNALNSQSSDMQNNIGSAIEQVTGNWESLRNKSQEVSKDFNISMLHMAAGVLQAATKSNTTFGQMTQHLLGYSTYIGVAMTATGTFMTTVNNLVNGTSSLGKAFTALTSPQMLLVYGITALAAILVIAYNKSEAFKEAVNNIGKAFSSVFGPAIDGAKGAVNGIIGSIVQLATEIGNNLAQALNSIDWKATFLKADLFILNTIQTVKNLITALINTGAVNAAWDFVGHTIGLLKQIFVDVIGGIDNFNQSSNQSGSSASVFTVIGNAVKTIFDALTVVIDGISQFISAMQQAGAVNAIWQFIGTTISTIVTAIGNVIQGISDYINASNGASSTSGIFMVIGNAVKIVFDMLTGVVKGIGEFISIMQQTGAISAVWQLISDTISTIVSIIGGVVQGVTNFITASSGMDVVSGIFTVVGKTIKFIADTLNNFMPLIAGVVAAFGAFYGIIGVFKAVTSSVSIVKTAIAGVKNAFVGVQTIMTIISLMNPFELIIVVIAAVVAAVVVAYNKFGWFRDFVNSIPQAIQGFWNGLVDWFTNLWNSIVTGATGIWNGFTAQIAPIVDAFKNLWNALTDFFTTLWSLIVQASVNAWANFSATFAPIIQAVEAVWNALPQFFSDIWSSIKQITSAIWDQIKNIVTTAINIVSTIISTVLNEIKAVWQAIWGVIGTILKTQWNIIKTIVSTTINVIAGIIRAVTAVMRGDWSGAWNAIKGVAKTIWSGIKSIVTTYINGVKGIINSVLGGIKGVWQAGWTGVSNIIKTVWGFIKNTVKNNINAVKGLMNIGKALWNLGKAAIEGFWNGLKSMFNSVVKGVENFAAGIGNTFKKVLGIHSPSRVLRSIGSYTGQGFALGLNDEYKNVSNMSANLAEAAIPTIKPNSISDAVNTANRQLSTGLNANVNGEMTLTKQPAYIDLNMNGSTYQGFVDDITNAQNTKIDLQNKYRL